MVWLSPLIGADDRLELMTASSVAAGSAPTWFASGVSTGVSAIGAKASLFGASVSSVAAPAAAPSVATVADTAALTGAAGFVGGFAWGGLACYAGIKTIEQYNPPGSRRAGRAGRAGGARTRRRR